MTVEELSDGTTVVHVVGELDAAMIDTFPVIQQMRRDPPHCLHIDATWVTFIDSFGIRALVVLAHAVRQRGGTVTMDASEAVVRVVWLCGLREHFGLRQRTVAR